MCITQYLNVGTLIINFILLIINLSTYLFNKRSRKLKVQGELTDYAMQINDAFIKHKVKSPYALHLNISDKNLDKFHAKTALLFHQINLLRHVYDNKNVLTVRIQEEYEKWGRSILMPWIESDVDLKNTLKLIYESKDLFSDEFIGWLIKIIPKPVKYNK